MDLQKAMNKLSSLEKDVKDLKESKVSRYALKREVSKMAAVEDREALAAKVQKLQDDHEALAAKISTMELIQEMAVLKREIEDAGACIGDEASSDAKQKEASSASVKQEMPDDGGDK